MNPSTIVLALLAIALAGGSRATGPAKAKGSWSKRLAVLRPYQESTETKLGWAGLADYLTAVAYLESKGSLTAVGDGGRAVGPYQMHPTTGAYQQMAALGYGDRTEPAMATAMATLHAWRLLNGPGDYPLSDARWSDVRAGWAIPSFARRRQASPVLGKVRGEVVQRFRAGALASGVGPNIVDAMVSRPESLTAAQALAATGAAP